MVNYFESLLTGLDSTQSIPSGTLAERPAPGDPGSVYKATDQDPTEYYVTDGDEWIELTLRGVLLGDATDPITKATIDGSEEIGATFPGFGSSNAVEVTAPFGRDIDWTVTVSAGTSEARVQILVEDSGGTFQVKSENSLPGGSLTSDHEISLSAHVPHGRKYHFARSGNSGSTETNKTYSFTDIGV